MATNSSQRVLEFHYDISCPFAYIASTRIEALAGRTNARLIWRPVLLGAIYRATDAPQGAAGSASDVMNPTKKDISARAFQRNLKRYNIPYNQPPKHPVKTTAALRLLYFVSEKDRPALTHALFKAYWVDGKDITSRQVLTDIVRQSDITDATSVTDAIRTGRFEGENERKALENATDVALQRGAFGVPAFWIPDEKWIDRQGDKRQGRLYWGQDRMCFVEGVLMALNRGMNGDDLQAVPSLGELIPRCRRNRRDESQKVRLEFWFDFSSPWAFLGWTQLARLRRQYGPDLAIDMRPILLGALFKEIGAPMVPMLAISQRKREYGGLDQSDWVRWRNTVNTQAGRPDKNIDFRWPDVFPIRTPTALRCALVEPELTATLFRGCWEDNLNMSSEEVVRNVINKAGFDGADILKRANSAEIKNRLRTLTQEAKDAGICGVPSYRVFRKTNATGEWIQVGGIVWGQDELGVVEDLISGWDESSDEIATVGSHHQQGDGSRTSGQARL